MVWLANMLGKPSQFERKNSLWIQNAHKTSPMSFHVDISVRCLIFSNFKALGKNRSLELTKRLLSTPLQKHVNNHTGKVNGAIFVTRKHMSPEGPICQKVGGYFRKCMLQHAKGQVELLEMHCFTVFITTLSLIFLVESSRAVKWRLVSISQGALGCEAPGNEIKSLSKNIIRAALPISKFHATLPRKE